MVQICGYLLQCLLIGYATVMVLCGGRSVSWPLALGLGISIGCCEASLLLFYAALVGVRPSCGTLLVADAVTTVALLVLHRTGRHALPQWPTDWSPTGSWAKALWYFIPAALVVYSLVTAVRIAISTPLIEWDAWAIWLYKAKVVAAADLVPPPWIFTNPSGAGHPHYPLLWPTLAAGIFAITGSGDDHLVRIVPVFLWIGWGLTTYSALRWKLPRLPATMLAALQFTLPAVIQYTTNGDADVVLAVFYGGMIYLILRLGHEARWSFLILSAVMGTGAAFTKNEGMPLACFGAALVLAMTWKRGVGKAALMAGAFAGIIGAAMLPWYVWSRDFPRADENYPSHISAVMNRHNLARVPNILSAFGHEFLRFSNWGPLWVLLPIAAVIGWRAIRSPCIQVLWALLGAHFLLYVLIYVISPMDVSWLMGVSLTRLLIHMVPIVILLIGYHSSSLFSANHPEAVACQ
jgi:hypothetical protein